MHWACAGRRPGGAHGRTPLPLGRRPRANRSDDGRGADRRGASGGGGSGLGTPAAQGLHTGQRRNLQRATLAAKRQVFAVPQLHCSVTIVTTIQLDRRTLCALSHCPNHVLEPFDK